MGEDGAYVPPLLGDRMRLREMKGLAQSHLLTGGETELKVPWQNYPPEPSVLPAPVSPSTAWWVARESHPGGLFCVR